MTVKYKTVITKAGTIKLAAATVPNGKKVNFTAMAIGDGGGTLPTPDANQTKLINEVWRYSLNKISQDAKNKNFVVAELLVPPERGGFWMREMGLYDDTGTLIAVGNMAESYKPELAEGSGRAQTVRMVIMVSDIESVELTIDTSMVMATQDYIDDKLAEHELSRNHPDATLKEKGFTQLSNATDSESESVAATPKAVKAAYDLAKGKYTAQDATTTQKGIVQLSGATDSTSENLAATPKAVKALIDDYAFLKSNLLGEAKAAGTAAQSTLRDNIGLKSAALADVTTSNRDSVEGRVLRVGDYGLGKTLGKVTTGIDFKSYVFIQGEHLFVNMATCTNVPTGLSTTTHYFITAHGIRDSDASPGLTLVNYNNPGEIWCAYGAGAAGNRSWLLYRQYSTGYKPSPSDVGAVPVARTVNGHALSGDVNVTSPDIFNTQAIELGKAVNLNDYKTPGIYFQSMTAYAQAGSNYPEQLAGTLVVYRNASPGATQVYYVYNTSRVYVRGQYNSGAWGAWGRQYDTQNKPTAAEVGALSTGGGTLTGALTGAYTESYSFADQYNTKAPFYHAFTTSGVSEYHPLTKIRAWTSTNAWVFTQGVLVSGTALSYYLYCRGSGGQDISYKWDTSGNFTAPGLISPGNWTNFDGRYYTKALADARYVQNVQRGAAVSPAKANEYGPNEAPTGCVLTRAWHDPTTSYGVLFTYRPLQIYINGWKTIQG
ncbi:phage tail protein [Enterobacteriaceae bacterium G50]|nr:phage tail protein [Enterobacteriaceae bacterium G50]